MSKLALREILKTHTRAVLMRNSFQFFTLTHISWQQEHTPTGILQCWCESVCQEGLESHMWAFEKVGWVSCDAENVFVSFVNPLLSVAEGLPVQALKMEDKWVWEITNCLLDAVCLFGTTWAGRDCCCCQLELTAQIWHHWSRQQCGTEPWRGRLDLCHPFGAINCQRICFYISHKEFW